MAFSDAGRIGFVIKGNYDATATYEFLDVVYSNNATYIARKVTTGDPVTDTTAWFCALNADLNGMVHSATINPSASAPFAADWLMENGAVITPQSNDLYRVLVEGKERLYFWNGTSYEILSGGGHTIEKVNPISGSIMPMGQQDNLLFTGVNVTNDDVNKRTTIHGQLKVCATKAEWDALSQAEKDDPNTYWVRPWADTVAFATDKTPVGTVLSVATAKTGEVTDPVIHTPSGTFPTDDYLVCNGQSVPLNKYPALAKYFEDNFGSVNYFTNPPYVAGYFSLPNWSSDFPSNGVLVMKARESSTQITYAEVNDSLTTADNVWSAEKIYETIQILIRDTQYVSGLRYKNLGSQPTSEQLTKIASGDFTDFWNGDYWTYGGKNYRIVDNTNYYLNKGDTAFNKPGLIIMRDDNTLKADGSTTKYMKDTNDTTGGLKATKWWTTYRSQVKSTYDAWCGSSHIGQFRDLITNAMANGHASGWEWADCAAQLPGEVQIYGSQIWGVGQDMNVNNGGLSGYNTGIAYPQFALFRLAPRWITNRENYWLKDICSPSGFAVVLSDGTADCRRASYEWYGLRPFFILV